MSLLTRRRFTKLLGGAAATLPIAGAFLSARGAAQPGVAPVRFLAVRSAHGTDRNLWIPHHADGSAPSGIDVSLDDLRFDYARCLVAPLQASALKSKITVLDGLDRHANIATGGVNSEGHFGAAAALSGGRTDRDAGGTTDNQTLDRYLFSALRDAGDPARHIINASVFQRGSEAYKAMSHRADGTNVIQTVQPADAFGPVFDGFMPPDSGGELPPDYSGAQRGVYDHVLGDLSRLRAELTGSERAQLQAHIESMQQLRDEVGSTAPRTTCSTSSSDGPARFDRFDPQNHEDFELFTRQFSDVIAQAFACGLSRVATLMHCDDYISPYWAVPEIAEAYPGLSGEYHDPITHEYWMQRDNDRLADLFALGHQWQTRLFLTTLEALERVIDPMDPSGTSTVLDNTIVLWVNEFGHGPHDDQGACLPTIVAGGGGGRLKTGRYLRLRDVDAEDPRRIGRAVPEGRLLTTIAQAMGQTDVEYYGSPTVGADEASYPEFFGDLPELYAST